MDMLVIVVSCCRVIVVFNVFGRRNEGSVIKKVCDGVFVVRCECEGES